jgi:hypothetical protein
MRPCLGCGRLIQRGSRCRTCTRIAEKEHERPSTTAVTVADWQKLSSEVIAKQPWCAYCGTEGDPGPLDRFTPTTPSSPQNGSATGRGR